MIASVAELLEATRAAIAAAGDIDVQLGAPVDAKPGLTVLPYQFLEDAQRRYASLPSQMKEPHMNFVVSCLLMPMSPSDFAAMDAGIKGLIQKPIIESDGDAFRLSLAQLPLADLNGIFMSAGIPQRLAVPFQLHGPAPR